jgi:hypothetical protein
MAEHETDPGKPAAPLKKAPRDAGAADNPTIVTSARRRMVDTENTRPRRYAVDIRASPGVQASDRSDQSNVFHKGASSTVSSSQFSP